MDNRTNILSMLGLALRGKRLAVGEEPVEAVARARDARVILLASDAADNTKRRCRHFAEAGQCIWLTLPFTKAELGQVTGRSAVAIVAMTDVGMAASFVHKLELMDPKSYSEAAQRLDLKAKRAAERKAEMAAHEKNVRTGKYKPKHKDEAPEAEEPVVEEPREHKPWPPRGKRPYGQSSKRPYGDRKPRFDGDGEKRPYGDRKPRFDGDGEKRPYGDRKPRFDGDGEKRPDGDRKPYGGKHTTGKSRPSKENRPKSRGKYNPYAHSLPVKKGKGSFRKKG